MSRADPAPWRREPYRLLFPLGALLAWAGVLPWLFFALGATALYQPIFHSLGWRASFHPIAQVEGFLTCIAAAFLFTFLPRRTATAPAAGWQIAVAVLAPLAAVGCAWLEKWAAAQVVWLLLLFVLVEFTLRRMRAAPPLQPGFIWVGVGLLMGAAGAVLAAAGQGLDPGRFWVHLAGRGLLLQGLFTGLVLGTADLLATRHARSWWALALHALGSAVFFASFFVEQLVSLQLGFALRAVVTFFSYFSRLRTASIICWTDPSKARDEPGRISRATKSSSSGQRFTRVLGWRYSSASSAEAPSLARSASASRASPWRRWVRISVVVWIASS